ncbi:MAG: serine hydrolase domain-containing protein, partial [Ferruginibacter sp.]
KKFFCRKFSISIALLLLFQLCFSQYNFSKVDDWLSSNLKEIGGRAVLVIYKDGKLVYNNAKNDMSGRQKMITKIIAKRAQKDAGEILQDFTISTKERIASSSKWLSAALVMTFVDEGKLNLEDTIGKFLPIMTANGKGKIKIWQCLSHLTGINSGSLKESINAMKDMHSMNEAMAAIAIEPMEGEPGKTFHYSNTGLQIAGAIVEKIICKNFETIFAERIAKPCDMLNTDFVNGPVALPAGGAWSTAKDYLNFLQMILNEGIFNGKQVLSKTSVIEMQKNRIGSDATIISSPAEAGNWGYGFGEWTMNEFKALTPSDAVTSPGLFGSFPWLDNKKHYAGFLLTFNINHKGRNERYTTLKKLVDEALTIQ